MIPTGTPRDTPAATDTGAIPLAELAFADLRAYRDRLRAEEERVSYWRRLVHARLDLLAEGLDTSGSLTHDQLVRALGDTGSGAGRTALLRVRAEEPLPEVPDLADVWVVPTDAAHAEALLGRLREAERAVTAYRRALFERIDAAGAELVRRYRAQPTLALTLLS